MKRPAIALLVCLATVAGAGTAAGQGHAQTRQGFWFSGGMGWGTLGCADCDGRTGGFSGGLSLGGQLSSKLLLGVGPTLGMAVDTTGSMGSIIAGVKATSISIVNGRIGTDEEPSKYILVPFNDPGVGPTTATTSPDQFKAGINALFASGDDGGARWAAVASLVETCKLNGVDPQRYITDVLTRLVNGWPNSRIDELMPWHWAAEQKA